jgi:hypothetical protein
VRREAGGGRREAGGGRREERREVSQSVTTTLTPSSGSTWPTRSRTLYSGLFFLCFFDLLLFSS